MTTTPNEKEQNKNWQYSEYQKRKEESKFIKETAEQHEQWAALEKNSYNQQQKVKDK